MKIKTSSSAKKRIIKSTKSGTYLRRSQSAQHLAMNKSSRSRRKAKTLQPISAGNQQRFARLVPGK